ncbi:uncharacterized protein LOC112038758 [Quercus suber]|uniref:uncharacterized protein LOC112038758 n=1 Tax=Quercus suber TaxID=58331 RepID=UPI000CE251EE|nr:uncharacterized protein LOC112038758 [Quercus suber]
MAVMKESILSRLDHLDNILRHLEEIRGCNKSPKSSCASTTSSQMSSSLDFSPRSLEKRCRPINHVKIEAEVKGTLIERLDHAEERVLKLCLQLEEQLEAERKIKEKNEKKTHTKKGLKQFVQQCVKGQG